MALPSPSRDASRRPHPRVRALHVAPVAVLAALAAAAGSAVSTADAASAATSRSAATSPSAATSGQAAPVGVVDGVVVRLAVEGEDARTQTWLRTPTRRYVAVPAALLTSVATGSRVRLRTSTSGAQTVTVLARPAVGAAAVSTAHQVHVAFALPPGVRSDGTALSTILTALRGPVASFWKAQTGGRVTITATGTPGWQSVSSACTDVWALWHEVAAKVGFVEGAGKHLVVYVPPSAACPTGLGTIGSGLDSGGYVYVRATQAALLAHELGHNLGLGHSGGLQCDGASDAVWSTPNATWSARCRVSDYRDWYDVMGVSWGRLGTLSTAQAYRLGVLDADQVRTVTTPQRVVLRRVSSPSGLVSLRVVDPTGPVYTVEYRPAADQDAWLGSSSANWRGLRAGVLVRRSDPTRGPGGIEVLLLDASPSAATGFDADFDEPLGAGQSVTTGSGRVRLTVEAVTADEATIAVSIDGAGPAGELSRLGTRLSGSGGAVEPAPVATPWTGTPPGR